MAYPLLYEINTRCWLHSLAGREGRGITLASVPDGEFIQWRRLGFTHIWLMGVWTTGPRARAVALGDGNLRVFLDKVLPGWREKDIPGSPYAVAAYEVPAALGGDPGLKIFRDRLHVHGLKLLLDFVPNHVGLDHPWVTRQPDRFVRAPQGVEGTFAQPTVSGLRFLAHGKDPNFPSWRDTAQLDYRCPQTREAMVQALESIARRCDGVRCDMAMLLLNDIFTRTWARFPTAVALPGQEFWPEAIQRVKKQQPDFLFLAETYWGLEQRLQTLGFDFTYDKSVYDKLIERDAAGLQRHLRATAAEVLSRGAHFLENHDERRIATVFSPGEHRAAAVLTLGLPGMRLLYDGQLQGRRVHVPVRVGRRPDEPDDPQITELYERLLAAFKDTAIGDGDWRLLEPHGGAGENVIIIQWQNTPRKFELVAVNFAPHAIQCQVQPKIVQLAEHHWHARDLAGNEICRYSGAELARHGLHVDLPPHGVQVLQFVIHI